MDIARPHAPTIRDITRRYYTVWGLYSFAGGFLYGVYPLFLRSRGLTSSKSTACWRRYFVVMFLTDVPTGAFADALDRRRSFVLGLRDAGRRLPVYFFAHHYLRVRDRREYRRHRHDVGNGAIDAWGVDALDDGRLRRAQGPALLAHLATDRPRLHGLGDDRRVRRRLEYRAAVDPRRGRLRRSPVSSARC